MADLYNQGHSSFGKPEVTEQFVKQQHPLWRAGYRAAEKHEVARFKVALKVEKVDRVDATLYELQWNDLSLALNKHRYDVLRSRPQLRPLFEYIRTDVWQRRDEIKTIRGLFRAVESHFNKLLQLGYDDGVLSIDDLAFYEYTPFAK